MRNSSITSFFKPLSQTTTTPSPAPSSTAAASRSASSSSVSQSDRSTPVAAAAAHEASRPSLSRTLTASSSGSAHAGEASSPASSSSSSSSVVRKALTDSSTSRQPAVAPAAVASSTPQQTATAYLEQEGTRRNEQGTTPRAALDETSIAPSSVGPSERSPVATSSLPPSSPLNAKRTTIHKSTAAPQVNQPTSSTSAAAAATATATTGPTPIKTAIPLLDLTANSGSSDTVTPKANDSSSSIIFLTQEVRAQSNVISAPPHKALNRSPAPQSTACTMGSNSSSRKRSRSASSDEDAQAVKHEPQSMPPFVRSPTGSPLSSLPPSSPIRPGSTSPGSTSFVIEIPAYSDDSDEASPPKRQMARRIKNATVTTEDSDQGSSASEDEDGSDSDDGAMAALLARAKARQQAGQSLITTTAPPPSSSSSSAFGLGGPSSDSTIGTKRKSTRVVPPPRPSHATPTLNNGANRKGPGLARGGKFSLASLVKERTNPKTAGRTLNFEQGRAWLAQHRNEDHEYTSDWSSDNEDEDSLPALSAAKVQDMTDAAGQALVEHGVDGQGEPQTSPQKRKAANVRGQVESVLTTSVLPAASAANDTAYDPVKEGRVCWIDNVPMPPVPELTTASQRVHDFVRRATLGGVPASRLLADMSSLLESDMVPILCHLIKHACDPRTSRASAKKSTQLVNRLLPKVTARDAINAGLFQKILESFGFTGASKDKHDEAGGRTNAGDGDDTVTGDMRNLVVSRVLAIALSWLSLSSTVTFDDRLDITHVCARLAVNHEGDAYRDIVEEVLSAALDKLSASQLRSLSRNLYESFATTKPLRVQVELVRALPLDTKSMRDLQRSLAWSFLVRRPPRPSAGPSVLTEMHSWIVNTSQRLSDDDRAHRNPLIVLTDDEQKALTPAQRDEMTNDRDLYDATVLLMIALTDLFDELAPAFAPAPSLPSSAAIESSSSASTSPLDHHMMSSAAKDKERLAHQARRETAKAAVQEIERALTKIDSSVRQNIRSSDPLRQRAKNNLIKLATSFKYVSMAAMGKRRYVVDFDANQRDLSSVVSSASSALRANKSDVAGSDGHEERDLEVFGGGALSTSQRGGQQTTLLENSFVKQPSPSPKKAQITSGSSRT